MLDNVFPRLLEQFGAHAFITFSVASFLLALPLRNQRKEILSTAIFFCLSSLLLILFPSAHPGGAASLANDLYWLAFFARGVCVIKLCSMALYQLFIKAVTGEPPRILQDVSEAVAIIAWALIWMNSNGVDTTGIITTSAILTAVIGLSFQDTLGNIFGGLAIQFDRSVNVGDWVRVEGLDGKVSEIRWRYTAIETRNWETVLIPNSMLAKTRLILLGRRKGQPVRWRRWIWFNVDFRFSPTRVLQAVETALLNTDIPRVARDPAPNCVLMDLGESYGRYAVRYWLDSLESDDPIDSAVRSHIYAALERAGIPLSMPAHAVFLTEDTTERKERKQSRTLSQYKEDLRKIELFKELTDEELDRLATSLVPAPFLTGDVITRQGAEAHWLYLVVSGTADVVVSSQHGASQKVSEVSAGGIFGEMGLLTGEPRMATVIAKSDVMCLRLEKEAFKRVLVERPELANRMSAILAERKSDLDAIIHNLDAAENERRRRASESDILMKIRNIFGLAS